MAPTKNEVVTEFRTEEILRAAREVFAAKGFERATIDDVAQAAGVAKGTVYLYFKSKQEIYWAALRRGIEEVSDAAREAVEAADGIEAKIRAFVSAKLRFFAREHEFFRIYAGELASAATERASFQDDVLGLYHEQVELMRTVFEDALARREMRAVDPRALAFAVFDLTRGLVNQRLRHWSKTTIEQDVAFACSLIWQGVAPR